MNDPSPEPVMTWLFIRVSAIRIVIGVVLAGLVYCALLGFVEYQTYQREQRIAVFVWMPHQRELRIVREIEALGGQVEWNYTGPNWLPQSIQVRLPVWRSLERVDLRKPVPPNLLSELKPITSLKQLHLYGQGAGDDGLDHLETLTQLETLIILDKKVTNAGLEHLTGLNRLKCLYLVNTQVTDEGLKRLEGLTNLTVLNLNNAQTTARGRARLRKVLPNCKIVPEERPGSDKTKRRILPSASISK